MKEKKLFIITRGYPANAEELSFLVQELEVLRDYYDICLFPKYKVQERDFSNCEFEVIPCINHFCLSEIIVYLIKTVFDKRIWREFQILKSKGKLAIDSIRHVVSECYYSKKVESVLTLKLKQIPKDEGVVFYSYWYDYSLLAIENVKRDNDRIITRLHGFDLYNERYSWGCQCFKEQLENEVDRLLFISEYGKRYYETTFANGCNGRDKLQINYLGVRAQECIPYQNHIGMKIVSCSRLVPLKRVDKIIEALSIINNVDVEWTHIGDGANRHNIMKKAKQMLGGKTNITYKFIGYLESAQVFEYYKNNYFDCFILLSDTEGLPVSIMEAMSFGIPVVASNVGGVSEIVDSTNGYLIEDTEDAELISKVLLEVCSLSESEMSKKRENAYNTWKNKFDAKMNAKRLVRIIENID